MILPILNRKASVNYIDVTAITAIITIRMVRWAWFLPPVEYHSAAVRRYAVNVWLRAAGFFCANETITIQ